MHEPKTPYVEYCPVTVRLKLEFRACYGMGFEPGGEARVAPKYTEYLRDLRELFVVVESFHAKIYGVQR